MTFLLIPKNNSLSHITKCLSIMDLLKSKGHEVHLAISKKNSGFLNNLGINYHLLPDIQETDNGGYPSFKWFSNIDTIANCIQEEVNLINNIKPHRILGVFRFTLYASARITKVPFDSLICGCMIPEFQEVLGFAENEAGSEQQKKFQENFFSFAGKKFSQALARYHLTKIDDIRFALKGERTFLWDFPEFMPIRKDPSIIHIGTITLNHWPYDSVNLDSILDSKSPIAVVSFGTCVTDNNTVLRIVNILLDLGYKVIVAAGGQTEMLNLKQTNPRLVILKYAPLNSIFPYTSLLVTHGGQMTVFEALQNKIPVFVMPLQPEQAHNGVCLERIGCGSRLIPSTHFTGMPEDYIEAFNQMSDEAIKAKITNLVNNSKTKENLNAMKNIIERYHGARALVDYLEVK